MKPHDYRDLIASYVDENFAAHGLVVYTEVALGKTIIGKNRQIDVFILRRSDQKALALECKFQQVQGTTDEKIPYALQDLEALWIPGCLVYAGDGWSEGVLHTLKGSRNAAYCMPSRDDVRRTTDTRELDHVLAAVFGLWNEVLVDERLFSTLSQLALPLGGPRKVREMTARTKKRMQR